MKGAARPDCWEKHDGDVFKERRNLGELVAVGRVRASDGRGGGASTSLEVRGRRAPLREPGNAPAARESWLRPARPHHMWVSESPELGPSLALVCGQCLA